MKNILNIFDEANLVVADGYPEGTMMRSLRDEDGGSKTILLKLPKGFHMDAHSHTTNEQHFVLEGEYSIDNHSYTKGSYQIIANHEQHGPFESKDGALILIVWDPIPCD